MQHVILSTTSTQLGIKQKSLKTAKEMWDLVKTDAMLKSTLYILDTEDQLSSMKLEDSEDPATHLKQHFQLMLQQHENLMKMGSKISKTHLNMMIMSSLLESYRPTLQTITASERASALTGPGLSMQCQMKPSDLILFLIKEAQHCVINNERMQNSDQALAAHAKRKGKPNATQVKGDEKALNTDSDIVCHNCKKKRAIRRLTVGGKGEAKKEKVPSKRKARGRRLRWQLLLQWTMTIKSYSPLHVCLILQTSPRPSKF